MVTSDFRHTAAVEGESTIIRRTWEISTHGKGKVKLVDEAPGQSIREWLLVFGRYAAAASIEGTGCSALIRMEPASYLPNIF